MPAQKVHGGAIEGPTVLWETCVCMAMAKPELPLLNRRPPPNMVTSAAACTSLPHWSAAYPIKDAEQPTVGLPNRMLAQTTWHPNRFCRIEWRSLASSDALMSTANSIG